MNDTHRIISDAELETKLEASPAPRVTSESIAAKVKKVQFIRSGLLTICVLTMENGYTVTAHSACVCPENYNQEIGEKIAYDNAVEQVWALEGYLLKERLYVEALPQPDGDGTPVPEA